MKLPAEGGRNMRARAGRAPSAWWGLAVGTLTALAGLAGGCRVDPAEFDRRVFACDTAAPDPGCGTDGTGRPMACFAARQLGATDFCAQTCDLPYSPLDGAVCLDSSIQLPACHPSDDLTGKACAQAGLACYRTDLLTDEGVCTTLNPCSRNEDCRDPVRSACATSFLSRTIYPQAPDLQLDHMFCLQTGCKANGTSCSPGEACLQDVISASAHPPDICVPNCDSNLRCPPNFLCYKKVSTEIAPAVCIPGLLGFTCDDAIDCMLGSCVDNGIGYKVCTTACNSDADCVLYDGIQGRFSCVKNPGAPAQPGYCQTPDTYRGSICDTSLDCQKRNPAEICSRFRPDDALGTCLLPCPADGRCPQRGGVGHTCLPTGAVAGPPVCFPGYFGLPCTADAGCVGDLTCNATLPNQPMICTAPCATDADCGAPGAATGDRWVGGDGFCGAALGVPFCLPNKSLPDGSPCSSNAACQSGRCVGNLCGASP